MARHSPGSSSRTRPRDRSSSRFRLRLSSVQPIHTKSSRQAGSNISRSQFITSAAISGTATSSSQGHSPWTVPSVPSQQHPSGP